MYKVIMEGINEYNNIIMYDNIKTLKRAKELKEKCEKDNQLHYFLIIKK